MSVSNNYLKMTDLDNDKGRTVSPFHQHTESEYHNEFEIYQQIVMGIGAFLGVGWALTLSFWADYINLVGIKFGDYFSSAMSMTILASFALYLFVEDSPLKVLYRNFFLYHICFIYAMVIHQTFKNQEFI